jgi:hypothetical protein
MKNTKKQIFIPGKCIGNVSQMYRKCIGNQVKKRKKRLSQNAIGRRVIG